MSNLTLPGDIPGLLRRASPVEIHEGRYSGVVIYSIDPGIFLISDEDEIYKSFGADLALDLADATGRAHALWYLNGTTQAGIDYPMYSCEAFKDIDGSRYNETLEDGSLWIDAEALRIACLHKAGRL